MQKPIIGVLTVLAVLLLAVGGVAAHGDDSSSGHDDAPVDGAVEWGAWMEQHMAEHMGADAAKWMQERMGTSYEEMSEHMASREGGSMMSSGMGCH